MPATSATIGIQMHSGWGVLVAVVSSDKKVELLERRRISVTDATMPGGNQPYHHASLRFDRQNLRDAERYLSDCATACERLATIAIEEAVAGVRGHGYRIAGAAILQSAGRPLPTLPQILAAHPLIHTAEGEFFSRVARAACERLQIPVTGIRRRDLDEQAKATLGRSAVPLQRAVAALGKSVGPPWTADHKNAALAAVIVSASAILARR